MPALPPPLAPLSALRQFVCWFAAPIEHKPGKFNKFPCHPLTGEVIDAQDPANWTDAATAFANHARWDRGHGSGVGFVFTEADPYFFLDIDACLIPAEGDALAAWSPLALELLARLPGCAVEVSHSGRGLHVFGRATLPPHANKNQPLGLELYTARRFVALTGAQAQGSIETDATASLQLIAAQYFQPSATGVAADWTCEPVAEWAGPVTDEDLIAAALKAGQRSAQAAFGDGGGVTFKALWEADTDVLGKRWPGEGGKAYGASEADQTLADHLAFWTGRDCERMERLMRASALARPKWDTHRSYLGQTILKACAFVGKVATGRAAPEPMHVPPPDPETMAAAAQASGRKLRDRAEYMGPVDQLAHFAGCYYLVEQNEVFDLNRNAIMTKSNFDVVYGGYLFVMDPLGSKTTTSAWEAFTQSRVNSPLMVEGLCFRPKLAPGALVMEGNKAFVNSYVPYDCPVTEGDASPFLDLIARQLPIELDRRIFLSYLASFAQNLGTKFQWWLVLQGTKGNGKTAIVAIMRYIAGEQYSHLPNAHAMARDGLKFNSWIDRKLFIGVEEIAVSNKREFLDEFKVVVTNERMSLEGKGTNQVTGDNAANGILCTNLRDGVPIDADERRYAVLWMAQQCEADLTRDGMDGEYFPNWWNWFRDGGDAIIAGYLKSYAVEAALDPAGLAHRAPKTSSTPGAIQASLGRAEQEVQNAAAEGRPGFAGGWVSSCFLDQMLERIRAAVPRNRRRDMMAALGYVTHPALMDGRTNGVVQPDNSKPVLYLRAGHLALNLMIPLDIARAYSKAQEPGADDAVHSNIVKAFG